MKPDIYPADIAGKSLFFGVRYYLAALRLGWLPLALLLGGLILLGQTGEALLIPDFLYRAVIHQANMGPAFGVDPPEPLSMQIPVGLGLYLLGSLLFIPLINLFYRVAAGTEEVPGGFLYLRWKNAESVVLFLPFLLIFFYMIWVIPLVIGGLLVGMITGGDINGTLRTILSVIIGLYVLWLIVRSQMIMPIVAIEGLYRPIDAFERVGGKDLAVLGLTVLIWVTFLVLSLLTVIVSSGTVGVTTLLAGWEQADLRTRAIPVVLMVLFNLYSYLVTAAVGGMLWARLPRQTG